MMSMRTSKKPSLNDESRLMASDYDFETSKMLKALESITTNYFPFEISLIP